MPPPMPLSMPSSVADTGPSPNARALVAPDTANSASPAASKICTGLRSRSIVAQWRNVTSPAAHDTPR